MPKHSKIEFYRVGGCVRDALLGIQSQDEDFVVVGQTPESMVALGFQPVGKHLPVFLHPKTAQEYALARTERKQGVGYMGFVFQADPNVSLTQDLKRRDLTINAMAQGPDGVLIDPYGGQADLENRTLRHVSEAFVEDPLRVLRVARFWARLGRLGFKIDKDTMDLMRAMVQSGELQTLPPERLWKETERALTESSPHLYFQALQESGALKALLPHVPSSWFSPDSLKPLAHLASGDSKEGLMALALGALSMPKQDRALLQSQGARELMKVFGFPKSFQRCLVHSLAWLSLEDSMASAKLGFEQTAWPNPL